jgi:MFS superfamily sulfate permease-like transporter
MAAILRLNWLRMGALAGNFHTVSYKATALAAVTLLILIACRSLSARIPGPIVALLLATLAVYFFKLPVVQMVLKPAVSVQTNEKGADVAAP